jgi:hypothetical protein
MRLLATLLAAAALPGLTHQRAEAIAHRVTLYASDLPGFQQTPNPITAAQRKLENQFTSCYGGVAVSRALAIAQSPLFEQAAPPTVVLANSGVEVLPSAALALTDMTAERRPAAMRCFISETIAGTRAGLSSGQRIAGGRGSWLTLSLPGTAIAYGNRVVLNLTADGGHEKLTSYNDTLDFAVGPVEAAVGVVTVGSPPSAALEHHLVALVLARAKAALG